MSSAFMKQFPKHLKHLKNIANRSTTKYLPEALYKNLLKDGAEEEKVRQHLNEFLNSRKSAFKWEVVEALKKLRERKLYGPALELSEVMEERGMNKTVSDQAIHLDLIAKSRGIGAAETYFMDLPDASKTILTYGALMNCYCKELMIDKAEAIMEKMKELKFPVTSMAYNSLMALYSKSGQHEKIPGIIQEMKISSIMPDSFTYTVWMRALAAGNDMNGVERVADEMMRDERVSGDWTIYSNLASIYVDAGLFVKAENALKELEQRKAPHDLSAYQSLILLYGRIGNLLEVYRVWRALRLATPKTVKISYLNMIQALVNLKDLPGAENCFREWESGNPTYDIRIANVLMRAYLLEGSLKKAEDLKEHAMNGGKDNAETWEIYLDYYLKNGEMEPAVECLQKAISIGRGDGSKWIPPSAVVSQIMEHFEKNKDVEGSEGFIETLKKNNDALGVDVFESLVRTYAAAEKTSPIMRRRLRMENVELSMEGKNLLNAVCPE